MWSKKAPTSVGCYFYAFPTEEHGIVNLLTAIFKHKKELRAWYRGCHMNGTKLNKMPEKGVWSEVVCPHRMTVDEFNILMAAGETMGDPNQKHPDKGGSDKDKFIDWVKSMFP